MEDKVEKSTDYFWHPLRQYATPKSCFLPSENLVLTMVQACVIEKLLQVMTEEEIKAGYEEQEPYLTKMRSISCRGCGETRCPHNFKQPRNPLQSGQWNDRCKMGEEMLEQFLPQKTIDELKELGIESGRWQMPSRKNPKLFFWFKKGEVKKDVDCEFGKKIIYYNREEHPLSESQIHYAIKAVIQELKTQD